MSPRSISHIVRHEWRLLLREPAVGWAALLLLAATAYALAGGIAWQNARLAETAATAAESAEQIAREREAAARGDAFAGRVGGLRVHAPFPPGPLAAFSVGLADLAPERAEISIWKRPDTLFGRYQLDSPLSLLAGRFDLAFVVLYLLPLFVLALSYNLLSAEREGGTLPLVLMQPVSLRQLVAAKLLARLVWITAFLLVAGSAGALAAGLPATALPRLAGWLAVAWLYGVFWLAVAALVASLTRSSETAAATLAAAWLTVVLVIPGLLEVGVQTASPVPSRLAFVSEMRAASSEAAKESADLLARYYHEHPELAANGQQEGFMPAFYASERQVEERLEPLLEEFENSLASQQRLVSRWRFASPAVLAQEAFFDLAGSGLERQHQLGAAARDLLADWHAQLSPTIFLGRALEPADYDQLPSFTFAEPPVSRWRFAGALLGLLLPTLIALGIARTQLSRFPITP